MIQYDTAFQLFINSKAYMKHITSHSSNKGGNLQIAFG